MFSPRQIKVVREAIPSIYEKNHKKRAGKPGLTVREMHLVAWCLYRFGIRGGNAPTIGRYLAISGLTVGRTTIFKIKRMFGMHESTLRYFKCNPHPDDLNKLLTANAPSLGSDWYILDMLGQEYTRGGLLLYMEETLDWDHDQILDWFLRHISETPTDVVRVNWSNFIEHNFRHPLRTELWLEEVEYFEKNWF